PGEGGASALTAPGFGRCEVVVFSSEHEGSFAELGSARARTVIDAWAHRSAELSALPGIEQVFVFENRGEEIGVTMNHPHGQIYAYPYVTPHTAITTARAQRHRRRTGWPLEVHIVPQRPAHGHNDLDEAERDDLARISPEVLQRIDGLYPSSTPYAAAWHQAPVNCPDRSAEWMHLEITSPRRAENKLKF